MSSVSLNLLYSLIKVYPRLNPPTNRTYSDEEMLKFEIELLHEFMERSLRVEDYEKCTVWRDCIKRAQEINLLKTSPLSFHS